MSRWLRRLVLITLAGTVAGAVVVRLRRTTSGTGPGSGTVSNGPSAPVAVTRDPAWPPLHRDNGARWTRPDENCACPAEYPVKANDNSGIFHLPGGRFYDRTKPERCYSDAVAAAADGYRAAKA